MENRPMKYCLEFGVRGGAHTENVVVPTRELAEKMARALVAVFENDPHANGATSRDWLFDRYTRRFTWTSPTHFIAATKLDGYLSGPASNDLWRKPEGEELLSKQVVAHYKLAPDYPRKINKTGKV
jgi:hypothetical protein